MLITACSPRDMDPSCANLAKSGEANCWDGNCTSYIFDWI